MSLSQTSMASAHNGKLFPKCFSILDYVLPISLHLNVCVVGLSSFIFQQFHTCIWNSFGLICCRLRLRHTSVDAHTRTHTHTHTHTHSHTHTPSLKPCKRPSFNTIISVRACLCTTW